MKALELRAEQAKEAQEALQMTLQAEARYPTPKGVRFAHHWRKEIDLDDKGS